MTSTISNSDPNPDHNNSNIIAISQNKNVMTLNTQHSANFLGSNFLAWRAQMDALLVGCDLLHFVDGAMTYPFPSYVDYNY